MKPGHRFAIADDHGYWRQALSDLIRHKFPNDQIVSVCSHGKDLISFIESAVPDQIPNIVILDLKMPGMDGFDTAKWLFLNQPAIKIITLSFIQNETTIIRLLDFGGKGFLHKTSHVAEILAGIGAVLKDELFFCSSLEIHGDTPALQLASLLEWKEVHNKWKALPPRSKEIIRLLCTDLTYADIARRMNTTKSSIEKTARSLYKKFDLNERIPFVLMVHKYKLDRQ